MARKGDWTVCDLTGIIINDGVTIIPGYVSIDKGVMHIYTSDDPMNELALVKPWILHNRVKYVETTTKPLRDRRLQGKDFISEEASHDYLTSKKK